MNKKLLLSLIALGVVAIVAVIVLARDNSSAENITIKTTTSNIKKETSQDASDVEKNNDFSNSTSTEFEPVDLQGEDSTESMLGEAVETMSNYPVHYNITATVFWVGEPQGGGSSEDNAISAWDDAWLNHFGGYDDPENRSGYHPAGFTPKENPFYLDLPYNDFNDSGQRKQGAFSVVPWAKEKAWANNESLMKNRWVKLMRNEITCYGQIQDAGPYEYDDVAYVFGTAQPKNKLANSAGLDVSPALRDCLQFSGMNNAENRVDWQFVEAVAVPEGPWTEIITTSKIYWP